MSERETIIFRIPAWKKAILWEKARETNRTLSAYIEWALREEFKGEESEKERKRTDRRRQREST